MVTLHCYTLHHYQRYYLFTVKFSAIFSLMHNRMSDDNHVALSWNSKYCITASLRFVLSALLAIVPLLCAHALGT
jgi:hypothetical protein